MGVIAKSFRNLSPGGFAASTIQPWQNGKAALSDAKYSTYAKEGYQANEIVFACIEELATSAAEPRIMVKMVGKTEWIHEGHRVIDLLANPNPFMDRFEFFATIIMHRSLAGNAYAVIERSASGRPIAIWLMRPDRVRIVPDRDKFIARYEYHTGMTDPIRIAVEDVIHFKTRHPLDDFYGMPPLMPASGRVDIDNFMRDFVKTYFEHAGIPAAMLATKGKMADDLKKEIRAKFSQEHGASTGWHGLLVVDNTEATFTPLTSQLGPAGLVVPELDQINEARIAMVFGTPLSLIGAKLGMASSSYANRKSDRESFWDETLAPLYKEIDGRLNLRLKPNYPDIAAIAHDLSDVRALQEDIDKVHTRVRADVTAGVRSLEEGRVQLGLPAKPAPGDTFYVPGNLEAQPASKIGTHDPAAPGATP